MIILSSALNESSRRTSTSSGARDVHEDLLEKWERGFHPCATTSTNRVLRSAWTERPSDGETACPRAPNLAGRTIGRNPEGTTAMLLNQSIRCSIAVRAWAAPPQLPSHSSGCSTDLYCPPLRRVTDATARPPFSPGVMLTTWDPAV